ncbi:MAG: CotH kinase family protein [Treponema sp.]|uniref:CotH kinase family protein n=1 Tax=Treponema sp. TaxID=166 RepID=UPI00298D8E8E|nr:CotH kinase family protein [Treponema sp.]MCR5385575.1 CotH kinase family protein [Treponema sp.]
MKKISFLFTVLTILFLFTSCELRSDDVDKTFAMYDSFVLSNETLEAAGLPVVTIQTENNARILSKESWLNAKISISNAASDSYNFDSVDVSIRGRGNTTWPLYKKPFALKFSKKQQVLGMPKHKRWVLLANYRDNSFMKNSVAFYLSEKLGLDYTVRGKFVNLVLNGNYVGLYWLGEAIKVDSSRVNIDEDNDYLIECDTYYDENWKFKSAIKQLPYMVKNDDSMNDARLDNLENRINEMEQLLYSENFPVDDTYKNYIDIDSFAKFYLVNEIICNVELRHPKSCYFTLESSTGILKAGPAWDFDWGGDNPSNKMVLKNSVYYDALFKIPEFREKVNLLMDQLDSSDVSQEIDNIKSEINESAKLDGHRWGTEWRNPVGVYCKSFSGYVENLKSCVTSRVNYIKHNPF